eukprot:Skav205969  [mRNA]  locus=scaffold442:776162:779018:- [translate_table: standard]
MSAPAGSGLELYASLEEVGDPKPKLLPALRPPGLLGTPQTQRPANGGRPASPAEKEKWEEGRKGEGREGVEGKGKEGRDGREGGEKEGGRRKKVGRRREEGMTGGRKGPEEEEGMEGRGGKGGGCSRFVRQRHPAAELVSRLDKDTSGCLLIPLTEASAKHFTQQFSETEVQKCYVAVVHGEPPETGHITEPLRLVQLGGGTKYRAFVDDAGKAAKGGEYSLRKDLEHARRCVNFFVVEAVGDKLVKNLMQLQQHRHVQASVELPLTCPETRHQEVPETVAIRPPLRGPLVPAAAMASRRFWAVRLADAPLRVEAP